MPDRGTIESIAEDVLAAHWRQASGMSFGSPDRCACGFKTLPENGGEDVSERRARAFAKHQTERILDRLTADGWALVKVEEQEARDLAFHSGCRLCGIRDLTQPYVPTREFKRIHTNCLRRVLADLGDDFIKRLRAEPVLEGSEDEQ